MLSLFVKIIISMDFERRIEFIYIKLKILNFVDSRGIRSAHENAAVISFDGDPFSLHIGACIVRRSPDLDDCLLVEPIFRGNDEKGCFPADGGCAAGYRPDPAV